MVNAMTEKMPECKTMNEFLSHDGQRLLLHGVYRSVSIQQKKSRISGEKDHATVDLDDGTDVLLEPSWSPEGRRPAAEIQEFEGKQVEVDGIARATAPEPSADIAYMTGPCLTPVFSVRPREGETSR